MSQSVYCIVQTTSPCFEFLDPKDALYRHLSQAQASDVMPHTALISHDCDDISDIPNLQQFTSPEKNFALLKAPLGSGGDSLYFVSSASDVLSIIRAHHQKAVETPGFIDGLLTQHGSVPSWSLQKVIPSVILGNGRKCQVRAYIIYCNSELYLYTGYEVRQPMWIGGEPSAKEDIVTPTLQADLDFCVHCSDGALPYNFGRSKTHTERMTMSEADGNLGSLYTQEKVTKVMLVAFKALKSKIISKSIHESTSDRAFFERKSSPVHLADDDESMECHINKGLMLQMKNESCALCMAEMGIIGADLIVEEFTMRPYLVEINNNPAMPAQHKTMSEGYRQHLVEFVGAIVSLGISAASPDVSDTYSKQNRAKLVNERLIRV